jgi:hypothetical protein
MNPVQVELVLQRAAGFMNRGRFAQGIKQEKNHRWVQSFLINLVRGLLQRHTDTFHATKRLERRALSNRPALTPTEAIRD